MVQADFLLRGYSGWNTRRALEVLHEIFPKVGGILVLLLWMCRLAFCSSRPEDNSLAEVIVVLTDGQS